MRDRFFLGPVSVEIRSLGHHSLWPLWENCLDPFRGRAEDVESLSLRIDNAFGDLPADDGQLVSEDVSGLFRIRTYILPSGEFLLKYVRAKNNDPYLVLWMNAEASVIRLLQDKTGTAGAMAFSMVGRLIPTVMLKHDAITFHGVLMEHEGRGIIVSAPSGTGKTTHARLWRDHRRALILNGDRTTCCVRNGRWIGFSLPWCGSSGECVNRDVPLTAYVVLEQAGENTAERLSGLEAFGAVMPNLVYPNWDRELTGKSLDFMDDFLQKVPVFRLRCRPDVEAVETLEAALREL